MTLPAASRAPAAQTVRTRAPSEVARFRGPLTCLAVVLASGCWTGAEPRQETEAGYVATSGLFTERDVRRMAASLDTSDVFLSSLVHGTIEVERGPLTNEPRRVSGAAAEAMADHVGHLAIGTHPKCQKFDTEMFCVFRTSNALISLTVRYKPSGWELRTIYYSPDP